MATNLHRVRQNFEYQMAQIGAPTNTAGGAVPEFRVFDPHRDDQGETSGWMRRFFVERLSSTLRTEIQLPGLRFDFHTYELVIFYPREATGDHGRWHDLVDQDRHDIIKRLHGNDSTSTLTGIAGNDTQATGLRQRHFEGDEIRDINDVTALVITWRCAIEEVE